MTASNPLLRYAAVLLERAAKEHHADIWRQASVMLSSPKSERVEVSLGRISRVAEGGSTLIVPGKVLGNGVLEKKLEVGAFSFSSAARSKIEAAGGSALSIEQLVKKHPKGSGVKLVR
ncbi:MAG TPA: 50S ribosomal protein L18e [Nitrososphaerales archaeon]|nr:50S ribosomal protein L18e [Nitrososphaerales archaeon]